MEAYRTYTALNAEAPENQIAVNLAFINQAALNIKKKPQPLKGFEGKSLTELITITTEVYHNRETPKISKLGDWQKSYWQIRPGA